MLKQLKVEVWQANIDLVKSGLVVLTWGNVSGIDASRERIVIKPSGVDYARLKPADMVVVTLDGRVLGGRLRPSSDTPSHLELYRAFPKAGGVTHTHSIGATAFAQALTPIACFGTTHADQFCGEVPVTRFLTPAEVKAGYEINTGKVIVERFRTLDPVAIPGVLVAGHGPFTWGRDAADAVHNSVALEAIAEMALRTGRINPKAAPLPTYILDKHYTRKHGTGAYYGQTAPSRRH